MGHHALPSNPGGFQMALSLVGCVSSNPGTHSRGGWSSRRNRGQGSPTTGAKRDGLDMLHQAYELEAFDCNDPEEVITESIPHSCAIKCLGEPHLKVIQSQPQA